MGDRMRRNQRLARHLDPDSNEWSLALLEQERSELEQQLKAHAHDLNRFSGKGVAYANTTIRVRGNHVRVSPRTEIRSATNDPMKMANAVWNAYQSDLNVRTMVTMTDANTEAQWSRFDGLPLELSTVLDVAISELWAMHAIIFEFMGYDRLFRETFSLRMSLVKEKRKSTRPNHGITFYETRAYEDRRRYEDYVEDAVLYIPSRIYYQTDAENRFRTNKRGYSRHSRYTNEEWKQLRGLVSPIRTK